MIINKTFDKPTKSNTNDPYRQSTISINFDLQTLNLFCMYTVSENTCIRTSNLTSMKRLIDRLDLQLYQNDIEKLRRIEFIKRGLECRCVHKMKNHDVIMNYINDGIMEENGAVITNTYELGTPEINFINETISESLKHSFMYDYVDTLSDLCTRFKATAYNRRSEIVEEFESLVDNIKKEFRRVTNENMTEAEFSLADGVFDEVMADIYARETNPSRKLYTGMQGFNELVGGGLESGRVYLLLGLAAAGKSLTLLNLAYQIKRNNKNYRCKDKTKKPCIAILTMENSVQETISRLFSIVSGDRMNNYTLEEVIQKLRKDGELVLNDESPIDIIVKYKPNMSVDTTYLYTYYDDLLDRGYEMICLIQDHIKKIRPAYARKDLRLDLGEVVNDYKAFAIEKEIPVLTDSHLNRDGAKIVDTANASNKKDVTRLLGRGTIGESLLMLDNSDCVIIINRDFDQDRREYMVFFRQKMRDQCTKMDYVAQPFCEGSTIRLMEDIHLEVPLFKETLSVVGPATKKFGFANDCDYYGFIKEKDATDDSDEIFQKKVEPEDDGISPVNEISLRSLNLTTVGKPSTSIYHKEDPLELVFFEEKKNEDVIFFDTNSYDIPFEMQREMAKQKKESLISFF